MSINLLQKTLELFPEGPPDQLLTEVDRQLLANMKSESELSGDGMDIVLCAYQEDTRELRFSGANGNVNIWRDGQWIVLNGTRRGIGMRDRVRGRAFELKSLILNPGDVVYTWTDGFPDQFGGTSGKKLMTSGLRNFLSGVARETLQTQRALLERYFNEWKRDFDQVDDVCVVALRID